MTIELPPAQSRTLNRLLKSGDYSCAADVIGEGLRLLRVRKSARQRDVDHLRRDINAGIQNIRARKLVPFDRTLVSDIKARGSKTLAAERSKRVTHA